MSRLRRIMLITLLAIGFSVATWGILQGAHHTIAYIADTIHQSVNETDHTPE